MAWNQSEETTRRLGIVVAAIALVVILWGAAVVIGRDAPALGPYLLILGAVPVLCAGVALAMGYPDSIRNPLPRLKPADEGTWFEIAPAGNIQERVILEWVLAIAWNLPALPACLHYLTGDKVARSTAGVAVVWAVLLAGLAIGVLACYHLLLLRAQDARLLVPSGRIHIGDEMPIMLLQRYSYDVRVERVRLGLVCLERPAKAEAKGDGKAKSAARQTGRRTVFQSWKESAIGRDVRKGEKLRVEHKLRFPDKGAPSTYRGRADGDGANGEKGPARQDLVPQDQPRYEWSVKLLTTFATGPSYEAEFPLIVEPPLAGRRKIDEG